VKRSFSSLGRAPLSFGTKGSADGQLYRPWGLCLSQFLGGQGGSSTGEVIVCDHGNKRVQVFDKETRRVEAIFYTEDEEAPLAVAVMEPPHHHGKRIFVSTDKGSVQVFDGENYTFLYRFKDAKHMTGYINGIAVTPKGNIIVSNQNSHCVTVYQGEVDPKKFCDDPAVVGKLVLVIGTPGVKGEGYGKFYWPCGVCVNSRGHVIVAVTNNHIVKVFESVEKGCTSIGKFGGRGTDPGHLNLPYGIACDIHDNILVADGDNNRIQVFREDGTFLHSFGKKGPLPGEFNLPSSVAVDHLSGLVYVVDHWNQRVQIF